MPGEILILTNTNDDEDKVMRILITITGATVIMGLLMWLGKRNEQGW